MGPWLSLRDGEIVWATDFRMILAHATAESTRALRQAMWLCCITACGCLWSIGNAEAGFIYARLVDPDPSLLVIDGEAAVAEAGWTEQETGTSPDFPPDESPADDPEEQGVTEPAGMAGDSNSNDSGPSSVPAAACLGSPELPLPTLTAWLHHGQYLAVPPAPRSGQCRPP